MAIAAVIHVPKFYALRLVLLLFMAANACKSEPWQDVVRVEEKRPLPAGTSLLLRNSLGVVTIVSATEAEALNDEVSVVATVQHRGVHPNPPKAFGDHLHWQQRGNVMELSSRHLGQRDDRSWRLDVQVSMPAGRSLTVQNGMGDVQLSGAFAVVDVAMGVGALTIEGQSASLNLRSGTGNLRLNLQRLADRAEISTGHGDVYLTMQEGVPAGGIDIKLGKGDVVVKTPHEITAHLEFVAGLGAVSIPESARVLEGTAMLSSKIVAELGPEDSRSARALPNVFVKTGMGDVRWEFLAVDPRP